MPRRHLSKKNNQELVTRIGLVLFLVALGYGAVWRYRQGDAIAILPHIAGESLTIEPEIKPQCDHRSLLNGVCVESEDEVRPHVVAVMIENHPDARPQSGLSRASIVYEAPVEANYTRFMAIYLLTDDVSKVGPVRSLRPYYTDWLEEYGKPLLFHVGGSPEALSKAKTQDILNMNEFYRGWYYWRDRGRVAPHNVYTSSVFWNGAYNDYSRLAGAISTSTWMFASSTTPCFDDECVTNITVSFLPPAYEADWMFVTTTGRYARYQDKVPHTDDDGEAIMADTVIVQRVRTRVLDEVGRLAVNTVGSGQALIFHGGKMTVSSWRKSGIADKTEWVDDNGMPIALAPGVIWVEVLPQDGRVRYEKTP